jgi:hypothetical protein
MNAGVGSTADAGVGIGVVVGVDASVAVGAGWVGVGRGVNVGCVDVCSGSWVGCVLHAITPHNRTQSGRVDHHLDFIMCSLHCHRTNLADSVPDREGLRYKKSPNRAQGR